MFARVEISPEFDRFFRQTAPAVLRENQLAPLAEEVLREVDPRAAARFEDDAAAATARRLAMGRHLQRIEGAFAERRIPLVLLKGAALAETVYPEPSLRPMGDIDIWVRSEEMSRASEAMHALGYTELTAKAARPAELQAQVQGEMRFLQADGAHGLIELHWGPFPGWWVRRTARVETEAMWRRARPMGPGRHARRLDPEDMVIQVAAHQAINAQFSSCPLRSLVDLACVARAWDVDWRVVAERARRWRLRTVVWIMCDLADRTLGLPGALPLLLDLQPAALRRVALAARINPAVMLAGKDLRRPWTRHLLLLMLVDRMRDGLRLVCRTLWPERGWLSVRYEKDVGHLQHLWLVMRRGDV